MLATEGALWSAWNTFQAVRSRPRKPTSTGTTRDLRNPTYLSWMADRSGLSFQEAYNAVTHLVDDFEAPAAGGTARADPGPFPGVSPGPDRRAGQLLLRPGAR